MKSDKIWQNLHHLYSSQDWSNKPSIFAEFAIQYFPLKGSLLELGAGLGQDAQFFSQKGYQVLATDLNTESLKKIPNSDVQELDLKQLFPFPDESFNIVYGHLSVHYFNLQTTQQIFDEVYRVLKKGGIVAIFTNSTSDPEYDTGKKLEDDFFEFKEGLTKRYFSIESIKKFTKKFEVVLLDNQGETYKDAAKGIHNLIRFIGKKE